MDFVHVIHFNGLIICFKKEINIICICKFFSFKLIEKRVKSVELSNFDKLLKAIDKVHRKRTTLLIGIDGCGGSGKSTLAEQIKNSFPEVTVVHMDDFYHPSHKIIQVPPIKKPVGADFDWRRVLNQVLKPVCEERDGYYQRYDWPTDRLKEWYTVPIGGIVIIEGCYSLRHELADKYDLKIWVETPRETRLMRGLKRDGEAARQMWEKNWMVAEDFYIEKQNPRQRADIVIEGTQ